MQLTDIAKKAKNVVEIESKNQNEWSYRFTIGEVSATFMVYARVRFFMNDPEPITSFAYRLTAGDRDVVIMFGDVIKSSGSTSNWKAVFETLAELRLKAYEAKRLEDDNLYNSIRAVLEK
jgi:hypothetical protein